jgi:FkbM family methyltransferase
LNLITKILSFASIKLRREDDFEILTINHPDPDVGQYRLSTIRDSSDAYHNAIKKGYIYDDTWQFIVNYVNKNDVFYDLGANIGTIAIPVAAKKVQVHAFEILSSNIKHLSRSVAINHLENFHLVEAAVSDHEGTIGISGNSAWGVIDENSREQVPCLTIDDYARDKNVDIIKIDVEGSERAVLNGMQNMLEEQHPDIIIEANIVTCGHSGYSYRELLTELNRFGYKCFRMFKGRLCPWDIDDIQEIVITDYFATIKNHQEIHERIGWKISPISEDEWISSIITQDEHADLHKQYLLSVQKLFPESVRNNPDIKKLFQKWLPYYQADVNTIMEIGSA